MAGISLYFLYALWIVKFLQHLNVSAIDEIELVVIVTQGLRLAGVLSYYGRRPARADVLVVLFSLETFAVTGLIVLNLLSPAPLYGQLAQDIFSTWVAALMTILPPYFIFAGLSQMARGQRLVAVLLPVGLEFGLLAFTGTTVLVFNGTFTFSGFFNSLVSLGRAAASPAGIPAVAAVPILVPSVALYCCLLLYSATQATTSLQPRVTFVLPLVAAAVSLGWVYAAVLLLPDSLLSMTIPGFALVTILWAYMRK